MERSILWKRPLLFTWHFLLGCCRLCHRVVCRCTQANMDVQTDQMESQIETARGDRFDLNWDEFRCWMDPLCRTDSCIGARDGSGKSSKWYGPDVFLHARIFCAVSDFSVYGRVCTVVTELLGEDLQNRRHSDGRDGNLAGNELDHADHHLDDLVVRWGYRILKEGEKG